MIRKKLIAAGVKNLKEFGYPLCNEQNLLTDQVYKAFFLSMLKDNLGNSNKEVDEVIRTLIAEIESK